MESRGDLKEGHIINHWTYIYIIGEQRESKEKASWSVIAFRGNHPKFSQKGIFQTNPFVRLPFGNTRISGRVSIIVLIFLSIPPPIQISNR